MKRFVAFILALLSSAVFADELATISLNSYIYSTDAVFEATIGAMAGAIWGAFNGYSSLDNNKVQKIEHYEKIMMLSHKLCQSHI